MIYINNAWRTNSHDLNIELFYKKMIKPVNYDNIVIIHTYRILYPSYFQTMILPLYIMDTDNNIYSAALSSSKNTYQKPLYIQIQESESYKSLSLEQKCMKAKILRATDCKTGILLLKDLAIIDNDEDAQIYLGIHYLYSGCVEDCFEESKKWFLMAAENNNSAEGYYELGAMYGSSGDFETAKSYLDIAIEMGYGPALTLLKSLEKQFS